MTTGNEEEKKDNRSELIDALPGGGGGGRGGGIAIKGAREGDNWLESGDQSNYDNKGR